MVENAGTAEETTSNHRGAERIEFLLLLLPLPVSSLPCPNGFRALVDVLVSSDLAGLDSEKARGSLLVLKVGGLSVCHGLTRHRGCGGNVKICPRFLSHSQSRRRSLCR